MKLLERNNGILEKYDKGERLSSIGKTFGISRQRVWQVIKRERNHNFNKVRCRTYPRQSLLQPNSSEIYVLGRLSHLGIKACLTKRLSWYDLKVGRKKVEVKHCKKVDKNGKYAFSNTCSKGVLDFFVFVCGDLSIKPLCFIVPAYMVKTSFRISLNSKKKMCFLEKWKQLY